MKESEDKIKVCGHNYLHTFNLKDRVFESASAKWSDDLRILAVNFNFLNNF